MLGSDEKVGVWMIVMVEQEEVTGALNARRSISEAAPGSPRGAASSRFTENKLYTEYLRREGHTLATPTKSPKSPRGDARSIPSRDSSIRQAQPFQDF